MRWKFGCCSPHSHIYMCMYPCVIPLGDFEFVFLVLRTFYLLFSCPFASLLKNFCFSFDAGSILSSLPASAQSSMSVTLLLTCKVISLSVASVSTCRIRCQMSPCARSRLHCHLVTALWNYQGEASVVMAPFTVCVRPSHPPASL